MMGPYGGDCPKCSTSIYPAPMKCIKPGILSCPHCHMIQDFQGAAVACPNCTSLVFVPIGGEPKKLVQCPSCKGILKLVFQLYCIDQCKDQPKETPMTPTQTNDLLTFFEIPKPEAAQTEESKTSKPNLPKVDALTKSFFVGVLSANSGMGTALGVGLKYTKTVSCWILAGVGPENFDKAKETILVQLSILADFIKGLSHQGATVAFETVKAEIEAGLKAKAAKGAVGKATNEGDAPDQTEQEMLDALTANLGGKKKESIN